MPPLSSNLVLIGMPGSGKSTVGVILAKRASLDFLDTDVSIQATEGRRLQDIVDREGPLALRAIEERVLLGLACRRHVIATGGSAVYSAAAMAHLRARGIVIFLDVSVATLEERLRDFDSRGIAKHPGQTLAALYAERLPLYRKYADITVACTGLRQEEICAAILTACAAAPIRRTKGLRPGRK